MLPVDIPPKTIALLSKAANLPQGILKHDAIADQMDSDEFYDRVSALLDRGFVDVLTSFVNHATVQALGVYITPAGREYLEQIELLTDAAERRQKQDLKEKRALRRWEWQKLIIAAFMGAGAREIIDLVVRIIGQIFGGPGQTTP